MAVLAVGLFFWLQRGAAGIFSRLGRRIAGEWFENAQERMDTLQTEGKSGQLAGQVGQRRRQLRGFVLAGNLDDQLHRVRCRPRVPSTTVP